MILINFIFSKEDRNHSKRLFEKKFHIKKKKKHLSGKNILINFKALKNQKEKRIYFIKNELIMPSRILDNSKLLSQKVIKFLQSKEVQTLHEELKKQVKNKSNFDQFYMSLNQVKHKQQLEKNLIFLTIEKADKLKEILIKHHWPEVKLRKIKLHNLDQAALNLNFRLKHQYDLKKDVNLIKFEHQVNIEFNNIEKQLEILKINKEKAKFKREKGEIEAKIEQLIQQKNKLDIQLKEVKKAPKKYELSLSNYHKFHHYIHFSFKFKKDEKLQNSHTNNLALTRLNVIVVDLQETRNINKLNDLYLKEFQRFRSVSNMEFYVKKKVK